MVLLPQAVRASDEEEPEPIRPSGGGLLQNCPDSEVRAEFSDPSAPEGWILKGRCPGQALLGRARRSLNFQPPRRFAIAHP